MIWARTGGHKAHAFAPEGGTSACGTVRRELGQLRPRHGAGFCANCEKVAEAEARRLVTRGHSIEQAKALVYRELELPKAEGSR